jgi:5'-nucleotidase
MKNKKVFSIMLLLVLLLTLIVSTVSAKPSPTVNVQILAVNDFHGNLEPPAGSSGRIGTINAGGAEYLATHINTLRALNPNTVVVSAGDMIGASPLLSALFHDEPSIEAFNAMGLDFNAVGNHEFDEGFVELMRMQKGGCHPVDGCLDGDDFAGAKFKYLAANVVFNDSDDEDDDDSEKNKDEDLKTLFPAYKIREFNSVKVAFIGMTLEGTPSIVTPSGVAGLTFLDEADTVNALIPELKKEGVQTIVVLIHEGGAQVAPAPYNGCEGISGAIVDIVNRFDPEVDVVISGHTHNAYNCTINNMLVTSAASFGRVVTDVDLTINRKSGEVVSMSANNNIVTRDVAKNGFITALIAKYNAIAAPLANRVVGAITATITRTNNASGESALGDVIADAQLFATADPANGGAVVAFMNPGGIRTDLNYASSAAGEGDGNVTYGESFAVQPFGNNLMTITMTGAQIKAALEQQFNNPALGQNRILQVSNGFTYSWSLSAPVGSKVSNMMLNGVAINDTSAYRVTVNNFLADGGDNFAAFKDGTDRLGGAVDTDALEKYFVAFPLVAPGPQNRITVLP